MNFQGDDHLLVADPPDHLGLNLGPLFFKKWASAKAKMFVRLLLIEFRSARRVEKAIFNLILRCSKPEREIELKRFDPKFLQFL